MSPGWARLRVRGKRKQFPGQPLLDCGSLFPAPVGYGLRQTAWIDERNSFEQATRASARHLKDLAKRYNGNWELAMAAYNTGAGNIDRAISRAGTANFWMIYPYIAQETRNYVPNILAAILIAKNPEKYGFKGIKPEAADGVRRGSGSYSYQSSVDC